MLCEEYENMAQYNLYSYCFNHSVNMEDDGGYWPKWVEVTVGVAAIAGLAVATVCTGGVVAVVCGAALSGAVVGGASGAVIGAVSGGISRWMARCFRWCLFRIYVRDIDRCCRRCGVLWVKYSDWSYKCYW